VRPLAWCPRPRNSAALLEGALGGFGLGELLRVTSVEELLEAATHGLAFQHDPLTRASRLEPQNADGGVPAAVAPGVALSLAERPETSHGQTLRRLPDGSCRGLAWSRGLGQSDRVRLLGAFGVAGAAPVVVATDLAAVL